MARRQQFEHVEVFKRNMIPLEGSACEQCAEQSPATTVTVMTYNVLAACYSPSVWLPRCPVEALEWKFRMKRVIEEVEHYDPDIVCMQELDKHSEYVQGEMWSRGYSGIFQKRPGGRRDGCGVFWRRSKWAFSRCKCVNYNDLVEAHGADFMRDNVGMIVHLEPQSEQALRRELYDGTEEPVDIGEVTPGMPVVVANTHLYWDPEFEHVKQCQIEMLCSALEMELECGGMEDPKRLVIFCGDLNSMPETAMVERVRESALNFASAYDQLGNPPTNFTTKFTGCLDYIWYSSSIADATRVLEPLTPEHAPLEDCADLPNNHLPSDHVCLVAQLRLKHASSQ